MHGHDQVRICSPAVGHIYIRSSNRSVVRCNDDSMCGGLKGACDLTKDQCDCTAVSGSSPAQHQSDGEVKRLPLGLPEGWLLVVG